MNFLFLLVLGLTGLGSALPPPNDESATTAGHLPERALPPCPTKAIKGMHRPCRMVEGSFSEGRVPHAAVEKRAQGSATDVMIVPVWTEAPDPVTSQASQQWEPGPELSPSSTHAEKRAEQATVMDVPVRTEGPDAAKRSAAPEPTSMPVAAESATKDEELEERSSPHHGHFLEGSGLSHKGKPLHGPYEARDVDSAAVSSDGAEEGAAEEAETSARKRRCHFMNSTRRCRKVSHGQRRDESSAAEADVDDDVVDGPEDSNGESKQDPGNYGCKFMRWRKPRYCKAMKWRCFCINREPRWGHYDS